MPKKIFLEKIIDNIEIDLPIELQDLNLVNFGMDYKLYDYQQKGIEKALKMLFFFYNGSSNGNFLKLFKQYQNQGLDEEQIAEFNISRNNNNFDFMSRYYPIFENRFIEFKNLINRVGFWMATGSGKTIIMIKLIEILFKMAKAGYIPQKDILILAPKNVILEQIKKHVNMFNCGNEIKIELKDLREYETEKYQQLNMFSSKDKITVFYYRADNIREENSEAYVDYRTYLNDGNWYLILDEAHKGDNEFSKSQQYYNVLSQNGFLFNFSATFTDKLDIATTLYNFNLERFISSGYGKHIKLTNQEYKSFRKNKDTEFSDEERQKIVLKSLVTFAAVKKIKEQIAEIDGSLFHNPLMITIANSVNTMDADLKIFFRELSKIAEGKFDIEEIKAELINDFRNDGNYYFNYGEEINSCFIDAINNLKKDEIIKYVFNSESCGTIEIITITNNSKEIAFKLTTSNKPFALLDASEATKWIENILSEFSHSKDIVNESFFENINDKKNSINILLGSRIFVEGWDSNRPNVINFINLGVGEAQKLVLQAIGRGVRINPFANERKRIEYLSYDSNQKNRVEKYAQAVQSLFIFSTNKNTIKEIIDNLDKNNVDDDWVSIKGFRKNKNVNQKLLKPVIVDSKCTDFDRKFKISAKELKEIQNYLTPVNTKIAFIDNNIDIDTFDKIENSQKYFTFTNTLSREGVQNSLLRINRFFKQKTYLLKEYSYIENNDIQSYRKIQIKNLPSNEHKILEEQIQNILENLNCSVEALAKKLQSKEIGLEEFLAKQKIAANSDITFDKIDTKLSKMVQEHYYNPMIVAKKGFEDYFRNVVQDESEIDFLHDFMGYIDKSDTLKHYDWWYFSKLVENVDNIKIPYYNTKEEKISQFYPDFIFWLKRNNKYYMKLIDPKGIEHPRNAVDKINGFNHIFNSIKKFDSYDVKTELYYYNQKEPSELRDELNNYWTNDFDYIFSEE